MRFYAVVGALTVLLVYAAASLLLASWLTSTDLSEGSASPTHLQCTVAWFVIHVAALCLFASFEDGRPKGVE